MLVKDRDDADTAFNKKVRLKQSVLIVRQSGYKLLSNTILGSEKTDNLNIKTTCLTLKHTF